MRNCRAFTSATWRNRTCDREADFAATPPRRILRSIDNRGGVYGAHIARHITFLFPPADKSPARLASRNFCAFLLATDDPFGRDDGREQFNVGGRSPGRLADIQRSLATRGNTMAQFHCPLYDASPRVATDLLRPT